MRIFLLVLAHILLCSALAFGAHGTHGTVLHRASLDSAGAASITCSPAPCVIPERLMATGWNWSNFVINPLNPQQLLSGGYGGLSCPLTANYASFSSGNGGDTWTQTCLPPFLASNPATNAGTFAYDLNNVAYAFYNSENNINFNDGVMSTSVDNGATWSTPVAVIIGNDFGIGIETATVDNNPSSPFANSIYIVEGVGDRATGGESINVLSSHNGGSSFKTVNVQIDTAMTIYGDYSEIATGKDGTVYLTYRLCNMVNGTPCKIMFSRSTNGGTTWTKPRAAATVAAAPGQSWPNTSVNGQGYAVYQPGVVAIDNSNGTFAGKLYMVTYNWTGSIVQVVLTNSTNGGKTWGPLVPLSPITNDQFWPWVSVSSTGAVGITWLDRRDDPANLKYRAYLKISTDGGTTFGSDLPIDDGLEDPTNVYAGILSTRNAWVGQALYTTWFSHGATMGTVVGGVQFK